MRDPQRTPQQITTAALLTAMGEGAITGAEMRAAEEWLARIREKVAYLYDKYVSGEAFWNDEGGEIIVSAVWEARLFELDAMLTAPATTPEEKNDE